MNQNLRKGGFALALQAGLLLPLAAGASPPSEARAMDQTFPPEAAGWRAAGPAQSYNRDTVYDYMDGGAEVYLAYGLERLLVQVYEKAGEPPITANLFEMASEGGAFGAFTFEREDEGAAVGQEGEYGGGLLRFWQGRTFALVQAERENPASREAVLALGRALAPRLGPDGKRPALPRALPSDGLRPLTVRYALSPLLLETLERQMWGNPLGLGERCETVLGKYGKVGNPERVLIARFEDAPAAKKGAEAFLKTKGPATAKVGRPYRGDGGWSVVAVRASFAVLVLEAPDGAAASRRVREASDKLKEVAR